MSENTGQRSRAQQVLALYSVMALAAVLLAVVRGRPNLYAPDGFRSAGWLILSPLVGAAVGLAVVGLSRYSVHTFRWARQLHQEFKELLGDLTSKEIVILACSSALGEELLFRGALLGWLGIWISSAIFALLHIGPGRRFLPWTAMSFVISLVFSALVHWLGDLGAPIVAHFLINWLNLGHITNTDIPADD